MKIKITESQISRQIIDGLTAMGWNIFRLNNQGVFNQKTGGYYFHGKPGVSDLLAIKGNTLLFVEVKSPTGKLSQAQKEFLGLIDGITIIKGVKACSIADILIKLKDV
jgi:Holliday junction resolvase